MEKPEIKKQRKKEEIGGEANSKKEGVIITVYVESPTRHHSHQNTDPMKKIKPNAHSRTTQTGKSRGSDRRAELLAYSRELRNADSPHGQLPRTNSRSRPKKWKWKVRSETPASRRVPSRRMLQRSRSQWRYESILREERTEVVDQLCRPRCFHGSNKKKTDESGSSLFVKLKSMLGELTKGCRRNKG